MKFIHLADCHLADSFDFDGNISEKIRRMSAISFKKILDSNRDVDFALIAGDLYERDYYSLSDYKSLFKIIEDFKKDVFYLAGNHDYIDDFNRPIFENKPSNFHVFGTEELEFFELGSVRIYGISYRDRIFDKAFDYGIGLDNNFFNILMAHGDVNQAKSSYLNLDLNKLKEVGFDYVGLGHIHKWHDFGDNIYYAGAIEPHDFTDTYDHGYIAYEDGKINHINSSSLKFYDLDIKDAVDEADLVKKISPILEDKENLLRLKTNIDIRKKPLKKKLGLSYLDLRINREKDTRDLIDLYPNSLLQRYMEKFKEPLDNKEELALNIGLDAIFRSQDD